VRKTIFLICVCLAFVGRLSAAESLTLIDGAALSGDIVKSDDVGLMLHCDGDVYTNVTWGRLSQDSLKQLAQTPKLAGYVEPFIDPTVAAQPAAAEIKVKPVTRLAWPAHPSVLGGLFSSSVGLGLLFLLYLANLYAGFEVALVRNRPLFQVVGVSAVLPVIGPAIYFFQPVVIDHPAGAAVPGAEAGAAGGTGVPESLVVHPAAEAYVQVESAGEGRPVRKPEAQVFARGKFTFNKRFIETKFAGFCGEPKGDGKAFVMSLKTLKETLTVERIAQTGPNEAIFETKEQGQVTIPYADIQEIKLNPIIT
jgi:hypothetical protein